MQKEEFLRMYSSTQFKKVIGYAGWAFGKLDHNRGRDELLVWAKGDESKLIWIEDQRKKVRDILEQAIIKNPSTLFILKQHPQENAPERTEPVKNEMSELAHYNNVVYLCEEESIHDLISVSDIWTCFESTTALESWLMDKQTIFINPEVEFNRDPLYKGSTIVQDYNSFQKLIDEFYSTGKIESFYSTEKDLTRKKLIKDIIGFGDGMNHIRASNYFQKTINQSPITNHQSQYNLHFWHWFVYVLIRIAGPLYNRAIYSKLWKFKKHLWVFENYKMEKLHKLYEKYIPFYDEFYKENNVDERFNDRSLFNDSLSL